MTIEISILRFALNIWNAFFDETMIRPTLCRLIIMDLDIIFDTINHVKTLYANNYSCAYCAIYGCIIST